MLNDSCVSVVQNCFFAQETAAAGGHSLKQMTGSGAFVFDFSARGNFKAFFGSAV
jgi:hypothetical protein